MQPGCIVARRLRDDERAHREELRGSEALKRLAPPVSGAMLVQAQHHEWRAARRARADERGEGGAAEDVVARLIWVRVKVRVRVSGQWERRVRVRVRVRARARARARGRSAPRRDRQAAGSTACNHR